MAADAWDLDVQDYARRAGLWPLDPDGEMILAVQIETAEGVDNLAEILAVPGVGAAFIGPADLYADMGHLGQTGVEEVEARGRGARHGAGGRRADRAQPPPAAPSRTAPSRASPSTRAEIRAQDVLVRIGQTTADQA